MCCQPVKPLLPGHIRKTCTGSEGVDPAGLHATNNKREATGSGTESIFFLTFIYFALRLFRSDYCLAAYNNRGVQYIRVRVSYKLNAPRRGWRCLVNSKQSGNTLHVETTNW